MTIEQMKERKRELGYTNRRISELSGVPLGTVQKIFGGETTSPRYTTLTALEEVLSREEKDSKPLYELISSETFSLTGKRNELHETEAAYGLKKQGEYTVEDVDALPEDVRAELIDGVLYDMAAPTWRHQAIAGYIHSQLLSHVSKKKGSCYPFISPIGVQLDRDEKTLVEPDVIIVCRKPDDDRQRERVLFGAPDFVMEVISPSSVRRDTVIKMKKYKAAGVREYWLIDPEEKLLFAHDFENGNIVYMYGFRDTVPVRIWGGECEINLAEMYESISFLYEE